MPFLTTSRIYMAKCLRFHKCVHPESLFKTTLTTFFFSFLSLMRGRIQIAPLAGHHRPASETAICMASRWRADDGPTLNAGLVAL